MSISPMMLTRSRFVCNSTYPESLDRCPTVLRSQLNFLMREVFMSLFVFTFTRSISSLTLLRGILSRSRFDDSLRLTISWYFCLIAVRINFLDRLAWSFAMFVDVRRFWGILHGLQNDVGVTFSFKHLLRKRQVCSADLRRSVTAIQSFASPKDCWSSFNSHNSDKRTLLRTLIVDTTIQMLMRPTSATNCTTITNVSEYNSILSVGTGFRLSSDLNISWIMLGVKFGVSVVQV